MPDGRDVLIAWGESDDIAAATEDAEVEAARANLPVKDVFIETDNRQTRGVKHERQRQTFED